MSSVDANALWALWRPTFGYVRTLLPSEPPEDIEDIVGDAMVRVLRADRVLDDRPHALRNYLLTVARNLVIDRGRRLRHRQTVPFDGIDAVRGRVDAGGDKHVALLDLRAALETVPSEYRPYLDGRCAGYRTDEMAARFGVPAGTVKSRNHRTYARLRGVLEAAS